MLFRSESLKDTDPKAKSIQEYKDFAGVDEGMTMKRIMPRAKGRADRILKRSCHITITVADS